MGILYRGGNPMVAWWFLRAWAGAMENVSPYFSEFVKRSFCPAITGHSVAEIARRSIPKIFP